jgi:prepilin-type N-terminal cleavage/methylation domain-containing protein
MRRRNGFTLVELLVVIAIIAILIAILLPVCIKIRNRALVLVCPIAYIGQDGGVYLTSPKGGYEVPLTPSGARAVYSSDTYWSNHPVDWSPCGRRLAYNVTDSALNRAYIHEPSCGKVWPITKSYLFSAWIDYDTYLGVGSYGGHGIVNANTGEVIEEFKFPDGCNTYSTFARCPPGCAGQFVAFCFGVQGTEIAFIGKNWLPKKVIRRQPEGIVAIAPLFAPKVDPFGEYVAWDGAGTNVHSIAGPSSIPVVTLPGKFCDWTEDGQILTNLNGELRVYTKEGKFIRNIPTEHPVAGGNTASYRKYGHQ